MAVLLPRSEVRLPLAELLGGLGFSWCSVFDRRVLYLSLGVIFVHIADVGAGGTAFWAASNCSAGDWRLPKEVPRLPWKRVGVQRGLRDPRERGCNGLYRRKWKCGRLPPRERKCGMSLPKEWMRKGFP